MQKTLEYLDLDVWCTLYLMYNLYLKVFGTNVSKSRQNIFKKNWPIKTMHILNQARNNLTVATWN